MLLRIGTLATAGMAAAAARASTSMIIGGTTTTTTTPPVIVLAAAAAAAAAATATPATTTTTTTATTILPLLQSIRGGAGGGNGGATLLVALNLQREGYLLQEMATYATLTALILNAALRLWTSTKFHKDQKLFVGHVFTVSTALCVISGSFTAILFQMLTIYSKGALGMANDTGYVAFYAATAVYRKWGFRCFLTELSTFVLSFLMSLYNTLWEDTRVHHADGGGDGSASEKSPFRRFGTYIMIGATVLTVVGAHHIKHVLDLATQHIFVAAYSDKFA